MAEYTYKGFHISYKVNMSKENLYKADGQAIKQENKTANSTPQKFHTEHITANGAKKEIRKLIKNYIDFEWKEFYEIH